MHTYRTTLVWSFLLTVAGTGWSDDEERVFDEQIAPILARYCVDCHNPGDKKGGLDLTQRAAALQGGDSGVVLVPRNLGESVLWQRVSQGEMPPKRPLPDAEQVQLQRWIEQGATWGTDPLDPYRSSSERRAGYDWWSLQPVQRPPVPAARNVHTANSPVDSFVLARLEQAGLTVSPRVTPPALARRLAFDLTGLPPTLEDGVTDPELVDLPERTIDRLLGSPAYGERWARHWLDLAHFGESEGYEYDKLRPHAWRYRDWVIESLNRDLPYDEFARLQIAGDVLQPDEPSALVATGFLVGGAFDGLVPAGDVMRKIMRQDELEDLVASVGQTFLGMTVQCARCHDHKFDPIRQSEYYQLNSALAGVKRGDRDLPLGAAGRECARQIDEMQTRLQKIEQPAREAARKKKEAQAGNPGAGNNVREKSTLELRPIALWEFDNDLRDSVGSLHGTAYEGARLENGALVVDGKSAYVATEGLPRELAEKTLEAWVTLGNLEQQGGGIISLETVDGNLFDALVYGEREPRRWMAGSNGFARTQSFAGPEESELKEPLHFAITYAADGTISGYLQGKPYGSPYRSAPQRFAPMQTHVAFGIRHRPVGGNRMFAGAIHRAALYDRALSAAEIDASSKSVPWSIDDSELDAQLSVRQRQERHELQSRLQRLRDDQAQRNVGKTFAIAPQPAPVVHTLIRGNPLQLAEPVAPAGLKSLVGFDPAFGLANDAADAERRQKLAHWVTAPGNALFSRTIANRLWHYHFGLGLVPTPNDLGFQGGLPSHPELLDWLADDIQQERHPASRFSLKRMHRRLLTSFVYQQQSLPNEIGLRTDAGNRLLWRKSPVRLDAESVRDTVLAVADQLNSQGGGIGYQDFRPFLRGGTQFYEPLDPIGAPYQRRSIYRTWARGGHNQLLDTFDCPDPSTITPRRSVTNTPLQALSLLNNSFILRQADEFAARLARDEPRDVGRQLRWAFELACGRSPQSRELGEASAFVEQHGLSAFCRVLLNSNAFLYVD